MVKQCLVVLICALLSGCDKPSCGSGEAESIVSSFMKKNQPTELLEAASGLQSQLAADESSANEEEYFQTQTCLRGLESEVNAWFASAGYPTIQVHHTVPPDLGAVADCRQIDPFNRGNPESIEQCNRMKPLWYANFRTCADKRGPKSLAFTALNARLDDMIPRVNYSLQNVRTESMNSETGAVDCAADLLATFPDEQTSAAAPIKYKEELTSDGKIYLTLLAGP